MKTIFTTLFVSLLWLTVCAQPQTGAAFVADSLDTYVRRGMADWQIPGLAIAIVKDGKVVVSKGYGVREVGRAEPVDENTLFFIASNTKLFTATALAKLADEKKLSLDEKVTRYLPDFRLFDPNATALVTVRDLLCHRLGTKTFQGDFTFWDTNLSRAEVIRRMRLLKPTGGFRQDYGYCNSAFVTAGEIIPAVTGGQSWEDYVSANIVQPLGMTNTFMLTAGADSRVNIARPHTTSFGDGSLTRLPYDRIDNLAPAGSMVSCVKDLSKWLLMQLDSGRDANGQRVLPWSVLRRTRQANTLINSQKSGVFPTHFVTYGLGLLATDYAGRQVYWHTGGAFGFVTNTCFVPEENVAITILTNQDNQRFFEALRYQLLDAYLGQPYTDRSRFFLTGSRAEQKTEAADIKKLADRVALRQAPTLPLKAFAGTYKNELYGNVYVAVEANGLTMSFEHHPTLTARLDYMDTDEFRLVYSNRAFGQFPARFTISNGAVAGVSVKASDFVEYDPYLFVKISR
jgi:CubicO group peptidase (beta-lactamase class C family)